MSAQFSLFNSGIIGESPAIHALHKQIGVASRCDFTTLISGESGTGKELVARGIHEQSARALKPFVSVNCGALTEALLESELFGHERGAFTGANEKRKGLFETAHTGTIFLDEIGEMSTASQVKLLRVLQEGAVRPIGARAETSIDVRVLAATNRNLTHEMPAGRFREDLFYRIAVLTINTPPLRQRPSDIPILIHHFMREAEQKLKCPQPHRIDQDALTKLCSYSWPGNVRQLKHIIDRLVATTMDEESISADAVLKALPTNGVQAAAQVPLFYHENDSLEAFMDRTLLSLYDQLLAKTGNHSQAARLLRIDRTSLYQRLERARRRVQNNGFSANHSFPD